MLYCSHEYCLVFKVIALLQLLRQLEWELTLPLSLGAIQTGDLMVHLFQLLSFVEVDVPIPIMRQYVQSTA